MYINNLRRFFLDGTFRGDTSGYVFLLTVHLCKYWVFLLGTACGGGAGSDGAAPYRQRRQTAARRIGNMQSILVVGLHKPTKKETLKRVRFHLK